MNFPCKVWIMNKFSQNKIVILTKITQNLGSLRLNCKYLAICVPKTPSKFFCLKIAKFHFLTKIIFWGPLKYTPSLFSENLVRAYQISYDFSQNRQIVSYITWTHVIIFKFCKKYQDSFYKLALIYLQWARFDFL